ncbi:MAG TPA: choice-of-anchor Q domain-containing protein, partial [Candidatus Sumerlaeota bacterium]|nr:choice-of-anchor Q domain-containing protein [Candidatus Sumerlaeota bacterium]
VSFNAHTRVRYVITFWNWPQISIQDVVYNINSGTARVPVTLNGRNNAFPVSVSFLTSPGSALPGVDYLSQTGTLTWATGQTGTKYAEIPLTGGEFPEVSRHFFLKIHDPVGATLQADRARVNLYENLVPTDTLMAFDEAVSVPVAVETRTDLIRQWVSGFLPLGWEAFWAADPAAVHSARITAFVNGQPYLIGGSLPPSGQLDWNTAEVSDGWCDLALEFRNAAGGVIAQWTARMLIRNSPDLVTHAGTLAESETWAGDKVHVIAADVLIPAGFTLTIEPGAVVKFCNGTRLTVADSGMLEALGLAESPIVFTPIEDDTAGGDTNMDGNLSLPRYGTYQVGGAGSIQFNDWTELRYLTSTHTGTLVASEIWTGNTLHHVTGNLAIPNGLTLRILPGAIVKINNQLSITVAAGGSLLAHGSLAQPIVVTSIRDDGHGGDTNDDGAATTPAPGDWKEIRNNGGTVSLSHTRMVYGGWAQFSNQGDGMIRNTSSGSLTIDSCELAGSLLRIVAVDSGAVTIQNSILRDGRWAVTGNASLVNCVVYGCETGLSGSGTAVNSSITHCHGTMISGFTVQYCNLWNPPGMGQQTFPQTGTNGNISADPKYQGAEAGLFMPRFGSPLIDAADGTRAPELDARGAPRVDDPHMPDTGIAAANGAFPDIGAYEVATGARAEFDLVVRRVSGPASASIGDTVRVEWDTANTTGTRTAQGPWRDAVALRSDDPTLGDQEIPLGDVLVQASLRPGDVQTFSATFTVPPLAEGRWRFQATTNARRDLFEGLAANNNTSRAALPVNIVTPEADPTPGNVTTGTTGNAAGDRLVKFRQTAGRKVVVRAEFLPAQSLGRLFAGLGRVPTRSSHDLASPVAAAPSGRTALFVPAPTADRWVYLLVIADGAANATFHLTIEDATLELTSIGVLRAGAGGTVTIPLAGAGFDETMTAFLSSDGGGMFVPADMVIVTDSMTAAARFDLAGATPGLYDVMLEFDGSIANLEDAFTVTAEAIGPRLEARIVMPDTVRSGRQYMAWFEYGNSGDADLPAPYFKLTSPQEMLMFAAMAIKNISGQNPTAQRPWRSGVIEVLGISETQPVSVLKPGEMRRIPVFFQTPITPGGVQIEYEWLLTGRDPINWDEIAANIRPEGLSDETWGMVFARLQSRIGFTWGDFLTRMRDDADYFGRFGQQVWLIEDLWQF